MKRIKDIGILSKMNIRRTANIWLIPTLSLAILSGCGELTGEKPEIASGTSNETPAAPVKATAPLAQPSPSTGSGWNDIASKAFGNNNITTSATTENPHPDTTATTQAHTAPSQVTAPDAAFAESPSLYLRNAQKSTVFWRAWSPLAFQEAKTRNAPVFIVIGTSWSHDAQQMDSLVFEDAEISTLLNGDFVTIKVDADERPDIWSRYSLAYELINKQPATLPLGVFANADGIPFDIINAKPARTTQNSVGLLDLLNQARDLYRTRPGDIHKQADAIESILTKVLAEPQVEPPGSMSQMLSSVTSALQSESAGDSAESLRAGRVAQALLASGKSEARTAASDLLLSRFRSGQRDHVLGGYFFRLPGLGTVQFGKLLPVQSEYISANAQAYAINGKTLHKEGATEVLRFCRDWLEAPEGGFYSSQSPNVDGNDNGSYFTWSKKEIESVVGAGSEATVFATYLNAPDSEKGNLHVTGRLQQAADVAGVSYETANKALNSVRLKLAEARMNAENIPMVDKSIQAGWNGDMICAYLDAAEYTGDSQAEEFALKSANYLIQSMVSERQGVARIMYKGRSQGFGYLEDNVKVAAALTRCYEASGQKEYLDSAASLMEFVEVGFLDKTSGLYIDVLPGESPQGLLKLKRFPVEDGIARSVNAVAALTWVHLAKHTGTDDYKQRAERLINAAVVRRPINTDSMATWAIAIAALENGIQDYKKE